MTKIIVIGGGWSGCAAAISAKKAGADVILIERTDLLLGLGNVGGVMRNNGRYTATEESILLGGNELFEITDKFARHNDVKFPGHSHARPYDVNLVEGEVRKKIESMGIEIIFETRAIDVEMGDNKIVAIILDNGERVYGDSFVETTGSTGPIYNCVKYGNGCAMCVLRCPTFKGRVSISDKCGVKGIDGIRKDGTYGSFSGSVKLSKESLSNEIRETLDKDGVAIVPLKEDEVNSEKLDIKICRQYALDAFSENLILIDTGHAKLMAPYYPLNKLRKINGFENAKFEDPYSGGVGNSIRHFGIAPRDNHMKVDGIINLFIAGEKSGFYIGHTEAITTGYLAGHNAVRNSLGLALLQLPNNIAIGDFISYSNEKMRGEDGDRRKFTFAGADYFERMIEKNLYTTDKEILYQKVFKSGLLGIYDTRLV